MQAGMPAGRMGAPRAMLRPFLLGAIVYLILAAAVGAALSLWPLMGLAVPFGLRLSHVHLALLGSLSQAMLGAIPFFGVALLAALPPDPRLARAQWWLANAGTVALAVSFSADIPALGLAGGILFAAAAALGVWVIGAMIRRSVLGRHIEAWYYFIACIFGLTTMLIGLLLVSGVSVPWLPRAGLRLAHLHFGLIGWVSLTIVGTMHTFFPSVLGVQAAGRSHFALNFWLLAGGAAGLGIGLLWAPVIGILGGMGVLAASLLFLDEVARVRRSRAAPLPLAGAHLFAASFYFFATALAGMFLLAWSLLGQTPSALWLAAYAHIALVGWVLQVLVGAKVYLLPILAGGPQAPQRPGQSGPSAYQSARATMEYAAGWQFWLLNGGLWIFVASLAVAPSFQLWVAGLVAGALAMLGALALLGFKIATVVRAVRNSR